MPIAAAGVFTIDYTLFTNAAPGEDIQFGMDFVLTNRMGKPLSQLIFPCVAVGNNVPGMWNVDNHAAPGTAASLIFANAGGGRITDTPREILRANLGLKNTKFAVYIVDSANATVQSTGVQFGYSINTSAEGPVTSFTGFVLSNITGEHKRLITARCPFVKYA